MTKMPPRTRTPTMAIDTDRPYPRTIEETPANFNPYFPASLNLKGMETQTETGPFFIIAGVKTHCIAASVAG